MGPQKKGLFPETEDGILVVRDENFVVRTLTNIDWQGKKRRFMLVLSRKKDESIIVRIPGQEDIVLTVVRIDNMNKVRIGVEADKEVIILRAELEESRSEMSEVE